MRETSFNRIGARERGFGLVEIMVGVTIGLLALLIVYQVLALAEGYRRTTTAGGDAQSSGMISSYVLAADVANGGHTISESGSELANCPAPPPGGTLDADFPTTWRPIPVLIRDGGCDECTDAFGLFGGVNRRIVSALDIVSTYNPGGTVDVPSPLGFHRSHATEAPHRFLIADTITGNCEIAAISPWPISGGVPHHPTASPTFNDVTGRVQITPVPAFVNTYLQGQSWVVNLGPNVRKVRYDVQNNVLRRTDMMQLPLVPNPVASNVVLLKAQYGIDTNVPPDQIIDTWVNARAAPWREEDVLQAPLVQLKRIKAIRIALVVQSSHFERATDAEGRPIDKATKLTSDFKHNFFDCRGLLPCSGEMLGVVIPNTANYRYRVFEQVIPLTNQIWNPT